MRYNTALPYFFPEDLEGILHEFKQILEGNGVFTKGPKVRAFEEAFAHYVGSRYAIAVNSGTSALELVLKAIGLTPDDEVLVPVQTFTATGACVVTSGGTPVFCEIDENHVLDFHDLQKRITAKTRAVILVHFAGLISPHIFHIKQYLQERNIILIEDAAHAHGARIDNVYAGNLGDFACFSFYATKIMTTAGEGGMITTNDETYANLCRSLRSIGIDVTADDEEYALIGSNNRMSEIQAITGLYQLRRLEKFVEHRNALARVYKEELQEATQKHLIRFQEVPENSRHAYWRFVVILENAHHDREQLQVNLVKAGIKIDWPYQPLMHLQPVFKKLYHFTEGSRPRSEEYAKRHFCLPMHPGIKEHDARLIARTLLANLL